MNIGDPNRFAIRFSWERCPFELADSGQQATWAEIAIVCATRVLTRYVDPVGLHDSILGPASALAMWIGRSFPALASGERLYLAERAMDAHSLLQSWTPADWDEHEDELEGWLASHSLQSVGQGLILPNVLFWRRGDSMRVSWKGDPAPRTERQVQYVGSGAATVEAREVLDVLRRFMRIVAQRIAQAPGTSTSVQAIRQAADRLSRPWEMQFDVIAGRLGQSQSSLLKSLRQKDPTPHAVRKHLSEAYGVELDKVRGPEDIDSPVAMAARSASPGFSDADRQKLIALSRALPARQPAERLQVLRVEPGSQPTLPLMEEEYVIGYQRAEWVRQRLSNPADFIDVERVLMEHGCEVQDLTFDDVATDGVALWRQDNRCLIAINKSSPRAATVWGRRTLLAHELYHLLFDTKDRRFFGECRSEWTAAPSERKANAFAAELLLPEKALPRFEPQEMSWWEAKVAELCSNYRVGWELVTRQLQNRAKLPRPLAEALLSSTGRGSPPPPAARKPRGSR